MKQTKKIYLAAALLLVLAVLPTTGLFKLAGLYNILWNTVVIIFFFFLTLYSYATIMLSWAEEHDAPTEK